MRNYRFLLLLFGVLLCAVQAHADDEVIFRGRVTMEDGSPPGHLVTIQRTCAGLEQPFHEALAAGKTGEYVVRLHLNGLGEVLSSINMYAMLPCVLEAFDRGYVSSRIDLTDRTVTVNPRLPDIVLTGATHIVGIEPIVQVPNAASRNWDLAIKHLTARNWAAAEAPLKSVTESAPKFAAGWAALGTLYVSMRRPDEARRSLERAIGLDPKPLSPYMPLSNALIELKDWQAADATTKTLIAADKKHIYLEAYLVSAVAQYQLRNFDSALAQVNEAIRLDKLRQLGRAEYVLGLILEAKGNYPAAGQHMKAYIQQHPRANDIAAVSDRLANLGKAPVADLSSEVSTADLQPVVAGESAVPGGIRAFSVVAQMASPPSYQDFFLEYSRALSAGAYEFSPTREAGEDLRAFISSVAALENLGERSDNGTLVRIVFDTDEQTRRSRAIIGELGLKLVAKGDGYTLEPGDQPNDGYKQWALAGFGVDELELRRALEQKKQFTFEIPRENARLVGGSAWGLLLKGVPDSPGGPIGIFTSDWRFARVYSGLGAMDDVSAAGLVSAVGLANLIVKYASLMGEYGDAIAFADRHVAVPGGAKAQPAWAKLAGANPQNPGPFLRALFEKDQGRLLAFYYDLAHADAAHQQYFTLTPERGAAFYKWYRDSMPAPTGGRLPDRWQVKILQSLRIDGNGKVLFPGGRDAWTSGPKSDNKSDNKSNDESDDEILLHHAPLEAMAALVVLEEKRGAPMSTESAHLITQRYAQWRSLMPYFGQLPGLEAADFQALADFSDAAAKVPANRRNVLMGEWHSLVGLIVLGVRSGALTNTRASQFFRQACDDMHAPNASARVIGTVQAMAGDGDLDEALATQLLRLTGPRREAFEEVKQLQQVPRLAALGEQPDPGRTLAALSGAVYAAVLDPACLLVAEDAQLLSRHNFAPPGTLFAPTGLSISSGPAGTNFEGGFETFAEKSLALHKQRVGELLPDLGGPPPPFPQPGGPGASGLDPTMEPPPPPPPQGELIFRAGGRMVEVYATVTDGRGHYIDDLSARQFNVLENGQPKPVLAFEDHNAPVSVALVFDASGSMVDTLPPLKHAAMQLVDDLRPTDSVAVYCFNDTVTESQPFTSGKDAAKRAILKTHPAGYTSLYDALVRVNHDLAGRGGKKVIIVFSDGNDNASMLSASMAIDRAKARGIPIYTIAEGDALTNQQLIAELNNISQATGGTPFLIRRLSDIGAVFEKVSQDLLHGYLVAFQPSPGDNREWRKIDVVPNGAKGLQVRAREGFYVE